MIKFISLNFVDDNPYQTRRHYDEEKIVELAEDIRQNRPVRPETCGLIHVPVGRLVLPGQRPEIRPVQMRAKWSCQRCKGSFPKGWRVWVADVLVCGNCLRELTGVTLAEGGTLVELAGPDRPQWTLTDPDSPVFDLQELLAEGARLQLAVGHRRKVAFNYLKNHYSGEEPGWAAMPVDLVYLTDQSMLDWAWSENDKRDDITAIEQAMAIEQAISLGRKPAEVGQRWGLSESAISNKRRLLQLPDEIKAMVQSRQLEERHARELLPLIQVAKAPKQAVKLAKSAIEQSLSANEVGRLAENTLAQHTRTIAGHLLTWGNWSGVPDGCVDTCKACENCARQKSSHLCTRPDLYDQKLKRWEVRLLELAAAEVNLPGVNGSFQVLSPLAFQRAREKRCDRMAITYNAYCYRSSVLVDGEKYPSIYYNCLDGYDCACERTQQKEEQAEANPRQAEFEQWRGDQNRQAATIFEQTRAQVESYFQGVLQGLNDKELALFVCLVKSIDDDYQCGYNAGDTAKRLAAIVCNGNRHCYGTPDYVGEALLCRSLVYQLCQISTPIDEVKARLQVLRDLVTRSGYLGNPPLAWKVDAHPARIREILDAHPGHQELRDELASLESQIEQFSQEK